MKSLVFAVLLLVPLASAHLCLLSPEQRGTISGLGTPGADDCNLEKPAPCGGRDAGPIATTLWAGMKNTIIFQKNLDHFNKEKPGNFSVSLWVGTKQTVLHTVKDTNTSSLYVYTCEVDVPDMEADKAILQVVYYTMNPKAPPEFYQCADVAVKKPPSKPGRFNSY